MEIDIYNIGNKTTNQMGKLDKEELRIVTINNWTKYIPDKVKWKEVVEQARSFKH